MHNIPIPQVNGTRCARHMKQFIHVVLMVIAVSGWANAAPLVLDCGDSYPLGKNLEVLVDHSRLLTVDDVRSGEASRRFAKSDSSILYYGFTDAAIWVRFTVSPACANETWLLEVGYPLMDHISFFVPGAGGSLIEKKSGYRLPFSSREIPHRHFLFRLPHQQSATSTFFLRFTNEDRMEIPLTIWKESAFRRHEHTDQYVLGIYYGIVLVMILYNLFLFISIRDRSYLYYVLYIAAFVAWQLVQNGFAFEYAWTRGVAGTNCIVSVINFTLIMTVSHFVQSYLNTASFSPRLHRIIDVLKVISLGIPVMIPFASYAATIQFSVGIIIIGILIVLAAGVRGVMQGYRPALFFLIAWSAFLVGSLVYSLKVLGFLPVTPLTTYAIQAGSAIEVILLSLGLGDRINLLMRETERAKARASVLAQELDMARKIQLATIPKELPVLGRFSIAARFIPMESVGGDFYDLYVHDADRLSVLVTDVSGHGIPAALIASMVKIVFDSQKRNCEDPARFIVDMNRALAENIENQYLTACFATIDARLGTLRLASAGHLPVLVVRKNEGRISEYKPKGGIIGLNMDVTSETEEVPIAPGDRIIIHTDGLTEVINERREMFDAGPFRDIILRERSNEAGAFADALLDAVRSWGGHRQHFEDDLTLVVIDIREG